MPKKTRKTWEKTTIFLDIPALKSNISGFRTKNPARGWGRSKKRPGRANRSAGWPDGFPGRRAERANRTAKSTQLHGRGRAGGWQTSRLHPVKVFELFLIVSRGRGSTPERPANYRQGRRGAGQGSRPAGKPTRETKRKTKARVGEWFSPPPGPLENFLAWVAGKPTDDPLARPPPAFFCFA